MVVRYGLMFDESASLNLSDRLQESVLAVGYNYDDVAKTRERLVSEGVLVEPVNPRIVAIAAQIELYKFSDHKDSDNTRVFDVLKTNPDWLIAEAVAIFGVREALLAKKPGHK